MKFTGSPPHARGRPIAFNLHCRDVGITPACAGKTPARSRRSPRTGDHPRMRGEDGAAGWPWKHMHGSPPHARGRRSGHKAEPRGRGITPACAGKTGLHPRSTASPPDHPRMRGEDQRRDHGRVLRGGSPPHARGRLKLYRNICRTSGITPACAGKTACYDVDRHPGLDHPRMRGEDLDEFVVFHFSAGSPPHARGRLSSLA